MIAALRNEFGTWTQLTDPRPVGIFDQKAWFESLGKERYAFVVEHEVEAIGMVGFVRLDEYDAVNRSVRVGADVVPEHRHRGYGTRIY